MILHAITWHDHEASCTSHCLRLHVLGGQQEKRRDWEIFLGTLKMTHKESLKDLNVLCFFNVSFVRVKDILRRF